MLCSSLQVDLDGFREELASGKSLTEDQQRTTEHYNKVVANLQDI
jgi:hypothetical protein